MRRLFLQISLGILFTLAVSFFLSSLIVKSRIDRDFHRGLPPGSADTYLFGLLAADLEKLGPEEQRAAVRNFQSRFPFPIQLLENTSSLEPELRNRLAQGFPEGGHSDRGPLMYLPLRNSPQVLAVGPIMRHGPVPFSHLWMSLLSTLPIVILVGFVLAYPVVRRLKILEVAAARIGEGDLSARAHMASSDAIGSLAARFNWMAERLQSLLEGQRHLLQAVSHELRTPISRIGFQLEILSQATDEEIRAVRVAAIEAELDELAKLVDELLLFSRLDREKPGLDRKPIVVGEVVSQVVNQLTKVPTHPTVNIVRNHEQAAIAAVNERYFRRALQNVIGNAIRYADKQVIVTIRRNDTLLSIEVSDDGPGVPEFERRRIFEPFTRLDNSRSRDSGGVGLGLAIVKRIMEGCGGAVEVGEAEIGGAKFILTWPVS